MKDSFGRTIDYLRISLTDRCNFRCRYCMPGEDIKRIEQGEILTAEELERIVRVMAQLGIRKVRLTGGEPLVRKDVIRLVEGIRSIDGIDEIAMTSNGSLLGSSARALKEAGLDSVNISLDTLDRENFIRICGTDALGDVLSGIHGALSEGMTVKLNCVPVKEWNDSEIEEIAALAKEYPIDVRFIELMPIGCGKDHAGISSGVLLQRLKNRYGNGIAETKMPVPKEPAQYYRFDGFRGRVGLISPMSRKFCEGCRRIRLTAEGYLKLCLQFSSGVDLKKPVRKGCTDEALMYMIREAVKGKPREHHMGEVYENEEQRKMVQIGG